MSSLLDKILQDIKAAMKAGDPFKLSCLRLLHSDIKNIGINEHKEITDEVVLQVLSKSVKQRGDSLEQFQSGGRQDLVEQTQREIAVLQGYLPSQLSTDEVKSLVMATITEIGAVSKKDMGKVMKALLPKVTGRADGKLVSRLVSELLP